MAMKMSTASRHRQDGRRDVLVIAVPPLDEAVGVVDDEMNPAGEHQRGDAPVDRRGGPYPWALHSTAASAIL